MLTTFEVQLAEPDLNQFTPDQQPAARAAFLESRIQGTQALLDLTNVRGTAKLRQDKDCKIMIECDTRQTEASVKALLEPLGEVAHVQMEASMNAFMMEPPANGSGGRGEAKHSPVAPATPVVDAAAREPEVVPEVA